MTYRVWEWPWPSDWYGWLALVAIAYLTKRITFGILKSIDEGKSHRWHVRWMDWANGWREAEHTIIKAGDEHGYYTDKFWAEVQRVKSFQNPYEPWRRP